MSDNTGFAVPAGAKPWTPPTDSTEKPKTDEASMAAETPITDTKVDPSRVIPGLYTGATGAPPPALDDGVKSGEVISIDRDKDAEDVADEAMLRRICRACGAPAHIDGELDVSEEDKTRWLRHVLGENRFTQAYDVFGGRIKVTFRSRTTAENDMLFKQLTHEINEHQLPEAPYFSSPAYVARLNRLMLVTSLKQVRKVSANIEEAPDAITDYPEVTEQSYPIGEDMVTPVGRAHETILQSMDESMVAVLMTLLRRFDALTSTLVNRSSDPDFWKPADAER